MIVGRSDDIDARRAGTVSGPDPVWGRPAAPELAGDHPATSEPRPGTTPTATSKPAHPPMRRADSIGSVGALPG